jgi:hypothetical protein
MAAEHVVNTHVGAWRTGGTTPAAPALDAMLACWRALPIGEELHVDWPTRRLPAVTKDRGRPYVLRQLATVKRA